MLVKVAKRFYSGIVCANLSAGIALVKQSQLNKSNSKEILSLSSLSRCGARETSDSDPSGTFAGIDCFFARK